MDDDGCWVTKVGGCVGDSIYRSMWMSVCGITPNPLTAPAPATVHLQFIYSLILVLSMIQISCDTESVCNTIYEIFHQNQIGI